MPTEELFGNYHFLLEVSGTRIGSFLSIERAGAASMHKSTLGVKFGDITLKRGRSASSSLGTDNLASAGSRTLLLNGFRPSRGQESVVRGAASRIAGQPGRIVLRDPGGRPVAAWTFTNAWPSKISGPNPKSDRNVAVDSLALNFVQIRSE